MLRICLATIAVGFCLPATASEPVEFDRDIAPILAKRCLGCHSGEDAEGNLDLRSGDSANHGGENGPAIAPGDLANSLLWKRVASDEMPEDAPLPAGEKLLLRRWIEAGAQWGEQPIDPFRVSTEARAGFDWWSLQPLRATPLPSVRDRSRAKNAVDLFVLARLEDSKLTMSPPATFSKVSRRAHFDLTGLPPTAEKAHVADADSDAYEQLIDRLLASPHYGQRWARHWLDVSRFGESHGFEYNQPRNNAWPFRNWVIDALNEDLPYDEFVRQQVAGDVLYPEDSSVWAATGFLVAGPHNTTLPSSDKMRKTMRHDELEDMVGTIGQTFLGLTINCARCHDHKFDPITQAEYYQMVAAVIGVDHGERELPDEAARLAKQSLEQVAGKLKELRERKSNRDSEKGGSSESEKLANRISKLEAEEKRLRAINAPRIYMAISKTPPQVSRLRRGDVTTPAEPVVAAGLRAINNRLADFSLDQNSSDPDRRKRLAEWLTGDHNPLLARVIVNRVWHYHFGHGLVQTPSDFGFNGDSPSHPLLLDYLAKYLIEHEWNLKPLHRLILTSATYRQDSRPRDDGLAVDADNRLLWRMSPRRLTAEEIRDSILAASGILDDRLGGAGYRDVREYKYRGSHYYDPIEPTRPTSARRTVYRFSPRGAKRTILDAFDCPDPSAKAPNRAVTTTPLQSLSLMNNRFVLQVSDALSRQLSDDYESVPARVEHLFRTTYGRIPEGDEMDAATKFIRDNGLAALCRAIFNSNEFLYVR